jgi:hypothetical protein
MADEPGAQRAESWQQLVPPVRLVSALRMALNFKALVFAALGLIGTVAGWRVLGNLFAGGDEPALAGRIADLGTLPWHHPLAGAPIGRMFSGETWHANSPLVVAWNDLTAPFRQMYQMYTAPTFATFMYLLCCALWALLVWSIFGSCISRMAAVAFARRENASIGQLAAFVSPRLGAYFVAPLFPILGTFLLALLLAVLGVVMRLDVGAFLVALLWPLVLIVAFMMAFLLVGLFFGFPLMYGSISAEGTDAFGALSHAYSYVYQRPLHYLVYAIVAALAGVLGWYLVWLFAYWILALSEWGVSWGTGGERLAAIQGPESLGTLANSAAAILGFWTNCIHTLAFGFIFSYFWSATTVIYFLLRRQVDATELDEIYMPDERDQHGLPPLKTGPDGIPTALDDAEADEARGARASG